MIPTDPVALVKARQMWRAYPERFARDVLGIKLYPEQIAIMHSIRDNRITTVASCNAAGKTGTAGVAVPWFLLCWDESIVVTTAPTWRQVKDLLWREINTRYEKAKERGVELYPIAPNVTSLQISSNWFAVGVSSKDPTKVQGYHADSGRLLAICDEAAGIEEIIFEGVDSIITSELCRLLMIGNPTSDAGRFRDSFKPNFKANRIKISAFDTPNFKANNIVNEEQLIKAIDSGKPLLKPYPQLVSPIWVYERIHQWGVGSPMYQSRVRANFPEVGENNLIPLSWIEAAMTNERLERILGLNLPDGDAAQDKLNTKSRQQALAQYIENNNTNRGVDVARFGSDSTVITPRWAKVVGPQKTYYKEDTMQTAGRVWPLIKNVPTDITGVDVIGVGAGVVDRLHELQREQEARGHGMFASVLAVDVASKPTELPEGMPQMEFANKRAELYWKLRGMFERGEIYIMPGENGQQQEELMYELSALRYEFRGNKIYIEEKKEMKKRLQKSPDRADSLVLSLEAQGSGSGWYDGNDDEAEITANEQSEDYDEDEPAPHQPETEDLELSNTLDEIY